MILIGTKARRHKKHVATIRDVSCGSAIHAKRAASRRPFNCYKLLLTEELAAELELASTGWSDWPAGSRCRGWRQRGQSAAVFDHPGAASAPAERGDR